MGLLLDLYKSTGNEGFSKIVVSRAPYFGTIDPQFVDVKPGYVEAFIKNCKKIHNHLGTVHAAAMCNAAELVGGVLIDVSLPEGRRWIPSSMNVQYLVKAKTDLRAIAEGSGIDWSNVGEIIVPVSIFDTKETKVFDAQITMNVKSSEPRKKD